MALTIAKWIAAACAFASTVLAVFALYLVGLEIDPVERSERQMSLIWENYPFASHYVTVKGSQMHYLDEGNADGQVYLLLHGNPTSSYLWRDVIPPLAKSGARVIALDNIGFGASDRPAIGYRFEDHAEYVRGFIDRMQLTDVTLVVHDWGSALGFDYAARNPDNVKAIVFMEAITKIPTIDELEQPVRGVFKAMRAPGSGELLVLGDNLFVDRMLPMAVLRDLSEEEMRSYREPFGTFNSRIPTLVWPREIPFDGSPSDVAERVNTYNEWLAKSSVPKLLLYAEPGTLISPEYAEQLQASWSQLDIECVGTGLHFLQEDHGKAIGEAIVAWSANRAEAERMLEDEVASKGP